MPMFVVRGYRHMTVSLQCVTEVEAHVEAAIAAAEEDDIEWTEIEREQSLPMWGATEIPEPKERS